MYYLITVLVLIVAVLLILIVLVQNSKGGGLASNFSSSNQIMGVRKTTDFLEKATWSLAIAILVLSIAASLSIPRQTAEESDLKDQVSTMQQPVVPAATAPANQEETPSE